VAGEQFDRVRLHFFWDGAYVDVPRFTARVRRGELDGHMSIDLGGADAAYEVAARLESASYRGGELSGDGQLVTSGFAEELYWNLRAAGSFRAQDIALEGAPERLSLSGEWRLRWDRRQPHLQLSGVRMTDGKDTLVGGGQTGDTGELQVELSGQERRLRLSGSLSPFRLEASEGPPQRE